MHQKWSVWLPALCRQRQRNVEDLRVPPTNAFKENDQGISAAEPAVGARQLPAAFRVSKPKPDQRLWAAASAPEAAESIAPRASVGQARNHRSRSVTRVLNRRPSAPA